MGEFLGPAKLVDAAERFGLSGIHRLQLDATAVERRDGAAGQDIDRKIHRHCAGVKKIERPNVERAAREIDTAGRDGGDGPTRMIISRHKKFVSWPWSAHT